MAGFDIGVKADRGRGDYGIGERMEALMTSPPSFFSPKRTWFMRFQIDGWVSVNVRRQG